MGLIYKSFTVKPLFILVFRDTLLHESGKLATLPDRHRPLAIGLLPEPPKATSASSCAGATKPRRRRRRPLVHGQQLLSVSDLSGSSTRLALPRLRSPCAATVRRKAHPPLVDARLGSQSVGLTRHPASHVTRPATCCLPQIIAAMRWNAARKPGRGNRAGFLRSAA